MSRPLSIRWHSRAGQGAITVSSALAEILGAHGKSVQCFPEFGAEKRGAPVLVFNRISENKLRDVSKPTSLDLVVLLDTSLVASCELTTAEVLAGLKVDGKLLINTSQDKVAFASEVVNTYVVDGSTTAFEEIGRDIPNVPVLGALVKITGLAKLANFQAELANYLTHSLPEKVVAGNLRAFERGYNEVRKI